MVAFYETPVCGQMTQLCMTRILVFRGDPKAAMDMMTIIGNNYKADEVAAGELYKFSDSMLLDQKLIVPSNALGTRKWARLIL